MKTRGFALILALLLMLSLRVSAVSVPDLTKNGSITFEIRFQGEPVEGGAMALYRVGDIVEEDGNYGFALIPALRDSGLSLDDLDDPNLAKELARVAADAGLPPLTAPVEEGTAAFRDVPTGLYVATQPEAAPGFSALEPFLISMPRYEDGEYVTDVKARPKTSLEPEPTAPTEPTEPTEPEPTEPELPQTGQLQWPVPMLAVAGLALIAFGWTLRRDRET